MGRFGKASAAALGAAALAAVPVYRLTSKEETGYNSAKHRADAALGAAQNGLFALLTAANRQTENPFSSRCSGFFYTGTDGRVEGTGWKAGFAYNSIVPEKLRRTPDGKPDKNGFCLDRLYSGGGYQAEMDKLYSDQFVNAAVLSVGSDLNCSGKEDIIIMMSVDGIGITNGVCREIRRAVEEKLSEKGISHGDILSCTVSATHCHCALDTQGMYWKQVVRTLLKNTPDRLRGKDGYKLVLEKEIHDCIIEKASDAVLAAFCNMEEGKLYFADTEKAGGVIDKFRSGAKTQNRFSSFLFEGMSGKKTVISNIGAHPVTASAFKSHMVCCDYPHYMKLAMKDAGYDFMFIQGTQAGVSGPSADENENDATWACEKSLTKDDWTERYGREVAEELYENEEKCFCAIRRRGHSLTRFVLDSFADRKEVAPVIVIKAKEITLDCDLGLMGLGAASGMLGFNTIKSKSAESRCAIVTEIGYIGLGEDVVFITVPGEISPAVVYGTEDGYSGNTKWTGKQSWSGKNWDFKTIEQMVRDSSDDENKRVIVMGITNDAIGYNLPDTCTTESIIAPLLWYNGDGGAEVTNSMLMTVSNHSASDIVKGFGKLLDTDIK